MFKSNVIFPIVLTKDNLSFTVYVEGKTTAEMVLKVLTEQGHKVKCDTTNDARILYKSAHDAIVAVNNDLLPIK